MRRHGGEGICKLSALTGDAVCIGWPMHRCKSNIKRDHDADIVQTSWWHIEISVLYRVEKSQGDLLWEQSMVSVIYLGLTFRLGYNCIPTKVVSMLWFASKKVRTYVLAYLSSKRNRGRMTYRGELFSSPTSRWWWRRNIELTKNRRLMILGAASQASNMNDPTTRSVMQNVCLEC